MFYQELRPQVRLRKEIDIMARIKELYTSEIAPALMKKFEYKSVMQIPKLDKIEIGRASCRERVSPRV